MVLATLSDKGAGHVESLASDDQMHLLINVPRSWIVVSITSPACRNLCGVRPAPTPDGVPV